MRPDLVRWTRQPEQRKSIFAARKYEELARINFEASDIQFAREIASKIPKGFKGKVIDLGSGPGNIAIPLAEILTKTHPDVTVVCYDLNDVMLRYASKRANKAKVTIQTQSGSFTQLTNNLPGVTDAFVFSNTALHEIQDPSDLPAIFQGISALVGKNGGLYLRDLRLPNNQKQADEWKAEILDPVALKTKSLDEYNMFNDSQHAGFTPLEIKTAINKTDLGKRKGKLLQGNRRNATSRYWIFSIDIPRMSIVSSELSGRRRR